MAWWNNRNIPTSVKREQWAFEIAEYTGNIAYLAKLKSEGRVPPIEAYQKTQENIAMLETILHQANEQGVQLERTW